MAARYTAYPELGEVEKVERTPEETASLMVDVTRFMLSDLRHRMRISQLWGLSKRGAEMAIEQAIELWREELKNADPDQSLSPRESSNDTPGMEPAGSTGEQDVQAEQAEAEGVARQSPHASDAYHRAVASYHGEKKG